MTFSDLYERFAPDVYRFSFWLCGNASDADDLTAETFVRAWVGAGHNIQTETIKAYLFAIARNLYLKQLERAKRNQNLEDNLVDKQYSPEKIVADRDELEQALALLAELPEVDRAAFILRIEHEIPYVEIARILQISLSAAKVKVHRVRLK